MSLSEREVRHWASLDGRGLAESRGLFAKPVSGPVRPPSDTKGLSEREQFIRENGDEEMKSAMRAWHEADRDARINCLHACEDFRHSLAVLARENREVEKRDAPLLDAKGKLRQREREFVLPRIPIVLSAVIELIIVSAEIGFNYLAFQIFGLTSVETAIASAGILIAFVVLPHFIGMTIARKDRKRTHKFLAFCALVLGVAGFYYLALFRKEYLRLINSEELKELTFAGIGMFVFNMVMFLAIILVVMESTMNGRHEYNALTGHLGELLKEEQQGRRDAERAGEDLVQRWKRLHEVHATRIGGFRTARQDVLRILDQTKRLIILYRTENRAHRGTENAPEAWNSADLADIEDQMREEASQSAHGLLTDGDAPPDCVQCPYHEWVATRPGDAAASDAQTQSRPADTLGTEGG